NTDCNDNNTAVNVLITFYQDLDGDTFGNPSVSTQACTQPVGYVTNNADCNDNQIQYADNDNDGFGSTTQVACGVTNNTDCNDNNTAVNVLITFYQDLDGDTFGNPNASTQACTQPVGYVTNNTDCNDNQIQFADNDNDGFGSTSQVACGVTNNSDCNDNQIQYADNDNDGFGSTTQVACGVTNNTDCNDNNAAANVLITFYQDLDGDTFGNPSVSTQACTQPVGYVTNNTDCKDNQIQYADLDNDGFGSSTQVACGVANNTDCNDNNANANVLITFYQDVDGDTFGNPSVSTQACTQPVGYVTNNADCNDTNASINALNTYYQDLDGDGYGNPAVSLASCTQPIGYVGFGTDCEDTNAAIHPGAIDVCYDGLDNDCNGIIDNVGLPGGCSPIVTVMQPTICGSTISAFTVTLKAITVTGAQGYRFRITKVDKNTNLPIAASVLFDRPVNNLALSNIAGITYDSRYQFEVAIKYNNVWQPYYGSSCFVDTPNPVSTIESQCGSTLTTLNQYIMTTYVPNVNAYRFRVTQLNSSLQPVGSPQITTQGLNKFNMSQLTGILFATTYRVEVALRNTDGTFLEYNAPCNITTPAHPTTHLRDSQCANYSVSSNTEAIVANAISGATAYRFRVFNNANYDVTYTNSLNKFTLNNFSGLVSGSTYSVQVSVKFPNQPDFGPYGQTCTILKPSNTAKTIVEDNPIKDLEVSIYPNPFSDSFNIKTENISSDKINISVYDLAGRTIETKQIDPKELETISVGSSYPSGVYSLLFTQGENVKTIRIIKR
ncbi:MAG: T9SS type A sorting domain-containing protein, partial [Flavobacteriaceae bacterium]|nr:T9SS type A sorting domain-containing protein [Flavobacteriaceae bacterium]